MSVIDNGLKANIMRNRMEDKNTLQHKGSLYVGAGTTTTINGENVEVAATNEFEAGANNTLLVCDSTATNGLKYSVLTTDLIPDNTITGTKISSQAIDDNIENTGVVKAGLYKNGSGQISINIDTKISDMYVIDNTLYIVLNNNWTDE